MFLTSMVRLKRGRRFSRGCGGPTSGSKTHVAPLRREDRPEEGKGVFTPFNFEKMGDLAVINVVVLTSGKNMLSVDVHPFG